MNDTCLTLLKTANAMDPKVKKILMLKINDAVNTVEFHLINLYKAKHKEFNRKVVRRFMWKRNKMLRQKVLRLTIEQTELLKSLNEETEKMRKQTEEMRKLVQETRELNRESKRILSRSNRFGF